MRHHKRHIGTHLLGIPFSVSLIFYLNTTVPVILGYFGIALHDITVRIYAAIYFIIQFTATCLRFQDTMPHRSIPGSQRSRLIIIVHHVEHGTIIASVYRTVYPVVNHIVHKIKDPEPSYRRITPSITCPKITHESTVFSP